MVFHRRNSLRPIHSIKHIIDLQNATAAATKALVSIADAKDAPVLANTTEVEVGCKVLSLYLDISVIGLAAGGILNNIYMIIYKNPGQNITAGNIPNANATGAADFKRQIFHTEMLMLGSTDSDIPQKLFKGVIKIPKVFQNMRINDLIQIQLFSPGATANFCVQCIYKEYR